MTLMELALRYLGRDVDHWISAGTAVPSRVEGATPVFIPPLSSAEQATLADLVRMERFGVDLTLAEWQTIKSDVAGLKQYLGVASPTAAQTAAATKAIIRVLATIIRD